MRLSKKLAINAFLHCIAYPPNICGEEIADPSRRPVTWQRTSLTHFTITKINWLTLFKEMIAVYSENYAKPINTKCSITDCQSRWFIYLPLGLKGFKQS